MLVTLKFNIKLVCITSNYFNILLKIRQQWSVYSVKTKQIIFVAGRWGLHQLGLPINKPDLIFPFSADRPNLTEAFKALTWSIISLFRQQNRLHSKGGGGGKDSLDWALPRPQ